MASAQGMSPVIFFLYLLACLPPLFALIACWRRRNYEAAKERGHALLSVGAGLSAAALIFNLYVAFGVGQSTFGRGPALGMIHAIAAGVGWVFFWFWLFVIVVIRRKRRHAVY